jgi:MFS family permease
MKLGGRLGGLAERNFRLVFSSVTISALGDGVTTIALVFAVLDLSGSATSLGLVIAARQAAAAAITVAAGVWADRLPRNLVLVAAALVQGSAQAVIGGLLVTGHAEVWMLVVGGLVYGLADGFVIPTSQGLIPTVVSSVRLQQANALLGLSRSLLGVIGPAVGTVLVAVGSPGSALLVDAGTFFVAAWLLVRVSLSPRRGAARGEPFFAELRQGWNEFRRQRWIWTTIVFFGIGNCASTALFVLGPLVAKEDYSGASTWGTLISCFGVGTIVGGVVALRYRPSRPLIVSCLATVPWTLQPLGIALLLPFAAIAGPVAAVVGVTTTLLGAFAIEVACVAVIIAQPSVWAIGREPARMPVAA